ncbi:MAG: coiled-coil domain-containing protein, partial [Ruminococcus sp.]
MQKKGLIRGVSAALSLTILAGSVYCKDIWNEPPVWAWASSELESQKNANDAKIAEMQKKLDEIGKDQTEAEDYQNTLTEKIELQEENITIVDEQLTRIENEIRDTQKEISDTEVQINEMNAEIEVDLEQFKKRVRAMYISGNDSLASALVGATDFFDFLSKYDMISRIAKHDN